MVRKLLHKARGFPVSPTTLGLVLAGFVIRVGSIPFADNYKADAVSRIMMALNWLARPHIITSGVWPPLHLYLLALFSKLGNDPWLTSVMLSVILGSLAVVPVAKYVEIEFDSRRVALIAGILFVLYPLGFQLSLMSMSEVPFIFFLWLSMWMLGEHEARGNRLLYLVAAALALNAASAIRYESWPLTLLVAILYVRNWKHTLLFVGLGFLFPLTWTAGNWLYTGHALVGLEYSRVLMELSETLPAGLRTRLAFIPGIMVFGLTPLAMLLVLWGLCISFKSLRLLRCAVLSVATAGLVAWNVVYQMTLPLDPRYVFTATVFLLPYAALGLDRLISVLPSRVERYALPLAIGLSMLLLPYLLAWSGVSGEGGANLRPIPRADSQSRQVIDWLRTQSSDDDYWIMDHMRYREQWIVFAIRRGYDQVFMVPPPGQPGNPRQLPVEELVSFIHANRPRYMVYSQDGQIIKTLESPCPANAYQPILGAFTYPVFSIWEMTICELKYPEPDTWS